ncbi:ATP-binding protein [Streptomyces sp. DT203]|uniref:ATP-binding protein n=1 Tax=Streptomyces sp. DT203 TaxID=3393424 RepID=UPI003CED0433
MLCLDESGYLDLDKPGAKLLFQMCTEREERRAIAIASNARLPHMLPWLRCFTAAERSYLCVENRSSSAVTDAWHGMEQWYGASPYSRWLAGHSHWDACLAPGRCGGVAISSPSVRGGA